jgi:hypothetical protein
MAKLIKAQHYGTKPRTLLPITTFNEERTRDKIEEITDEKINCVLPLQNCSVYQIKKILNEVADPKTYDVKASGQDSVVHFNF